VTSLTKYTAVQCYKVLLCVTKCHKTLKGAELLVQICNLYEDSYNSSWYFCRGSEKLDYIGG
jgi:hypothetical protein